MQVTIQLPDDIAKHLGETVDMPRHLLEAVAAEAYRSQKLSRHQVGQMLGLDRWRTEEFLVAHNAQRPYTLADLEIDRRSLSGLPGK